MLAVLLALAISAGCLQAQNRQPVQHREDLQDLRIDVAYLSSDLLEGRETGTIGEQIAAQYIASRFAQTGLAPGGDDGWFQPFEFRHSPNPHAAGAEGKLRTGRNVVGMLDIGAARTVIVGAHYDHLGYGGAGSRQPGDSLIHNGADDNASGVAALLEIARQLRASDALSDNLVFVAFSGEELGLYGSMHFVDHPATEIENVNYMINLDMVGRLGKDRRIAVNGTGTSPAWDVVVDSAASSHDLFVTKHASGLGPSDHASFYVREVPVLHLFTGQHNEYHMPDDDSHLIDYAGIRDIASFVVEVIRTLDGRPPLVFAPTSDEDEGQRTQFTVTLGVMPDYMSDVEGMRIDAVLDNRAADQAGLQRGDIIIRLGDVAVGDINDYMEALSKFKDGDVTTVVARRGDEIIERKVRF